MSDKQFLTQTIEHYDRIEELFNYYLAATQLLGYAYAFLGESRSYEDIFTPDIQLIENENLQKLIAVENLYEEKIGETWYKNPEDFLIKIKDSVHKLFTKDNEMITIEITGKELLEAVGYGR